MNIFCPNCEKETECEHTAELYECNECGEDFAQYIVPRKPSNSDVSVTEDVLTDIKSSHSVKSDDCGREIKKMINQFPPGKMWDEYDNALSEISDLETIVEHLQNRLSEWQGVARQLADELTEANSQRFPVSWEDASESSSAWIAYRNLVDIEDAEANDAEQ